MKKAKGILTEVTEKDLNLLKTKPKKFWKGVKIIGEKAFEGCKDKLTIIEIPTSVTSIGYEAFCGCKNLRNVIIPNSVEIIGEGAFACCGLINLVIPGSVKKIEEGTFSSCMKLTDVEIQEGVQEIDEVAFFDCTDLKNIKIPASVNSIGERCFYITAVENYQVAKENPYFSSGENGTYLVRNNIKTKTKTLLALSRGEKIPDGVVSIEDYSPVSCDKNFEIPEGVRIIGKEVFQFEKFETLKLPSTLTDIGKDAFDKCEINELIVHEKTLEVVMTDEQLKNAKIIKVIATKLEIPYIIEINNKTKEVTYKYPPELIDLIRVQGAENEKDDSIFEEMGYKIIKEICKTPQLVEENEEENENE